MIALIIVESLEYGNIHSAFYKACCNIFDECYSFVSPVNVDIKSNQWNSFLKHQVSVLKPDIIISVMGKNIDVSPFKNIKKVSWQIDDPYSKKIGIFPNIPKQYDLILTTYKDFICEYNRNKIKSRYMSFGFNKNFHKKYNIDKEYDVSFVGTPFNLRKIYISKLNKIKGFKHFGGRYRVSFRESINIINKTKININFSDQPDGLLSAKNRVTEICGCGGFLLTQYFNGIEDYFTPEKECDIFQNEGDLADKISFYLKNDGLREKIANNGYKKASKEFEYSKLISEALKGEI